MTPEEWQRVRPILESALELDSAHRTAYLDGACGDRSLRREVESLIAVHEQAGTDFLSSGPVPGFVVEDEPRFRLLPGKRIGPYEILEEIALGGMGAVYRAIRADGQYKQQVALKIVRSELGAEFTGTRFKNERQILASLDHPNIAKILDGGTTADGLPYFVMEFIDGLPITEYCDQSKLTIDERLKIFRTVCSAVHYAHQHLVIHRDIKPGNILITSDGVPKLLDFGIAKILDPSLLAENAAATLAGLWVMTPEYASPEQLRGEALTTATDVYSLGLVLYELLAGHRAYHLASHLPHEIARAVLETEPEKPSTAIRLKDEIAEQDQEKVPLTPELISGLRAESPEKLQGRLAGDLDNIVMKAIRKDPRERYNSADQLSEDIRRHLEALPVLARKSTVAYHCRKYVLRHKVGVTAAALVFLSLLIGFALTLREARIARANGLRAEQRFNDVRTLANSLIFEIHDSIQNLPGATPSRKLLLDRALQYLDSLAKESAGDFSLQRELAAAYQRIGQLQGNALDANLGQSEAAITSLEKAQAIAESVAKANPTNLSDQLRVAYGHRNLASMLSNTGRPGARSQTEQAIAIAERLLKLDASNPQVLLEKASGYEQLAYFQDEAGDAAGSLQSLRNALAVDEDFWKADSRNRELQEKVAVLRVRIGNLLPKLGSRDEALQINRSGLDLFESLATDQKDARNRRRLAVALFFRGHIHMMNGDIQDALASFRRSLAMLQELEQADPHNVLYHLDVAGATASVGRALARVGKDAEGLAMLKSAIGVLEENYARDHSYTDIPYWLGQDHIWRGEILARTGHARGALDEYRKGASSLERPMSGTVSPNTRCDIAASYTKVGAGYAAVGNDTEASKAYRKALEITEPLVSSKPTNVLGLYAAADAYFGMGELAKSAAQQSTLASRGERQHHLRQACDWYRKSVDAWRQIPNPGRTTPSGFATVDPTTVARRLRACDAMFRGSEQPRK
jgi:eukaryotic-like serine/threonine-protein kinase